MTDPTNDEPWRPHPGALVQIWDHTPVSDIAGKIEAHGQVGYIVRQSGGTDNTDPLATGPIFEVIVFGGEMESTRHHVNHCWLREIKKTSDIKKVIDTE